MERISAGPHHTAYKIGDLTVTSLRDGYVDMPVRRLRRPGDKPFGDDLPSQVPLFDSALRLSVNAFAIDDGREITLIDTGSSNAWHPTMGFLPQALSEARIAVDRIRTVAFTHTHLDHIHGLVLADGRDGFPRLSRLIVPRAELDMFRSVARLSRFHDLAEPSDPGQRLSAHIKAVAAVGHEIGHTGFRVTSGGETLLVWGDLVHVPSLQFDRPDIAWEFDADQDQARATRLRILALVADSDWYVAGAHLDSPGVGRVSRTETGFRFEGL
ncbi:MBL fold metallo-hydrolase [Mesorhizobium sp. B4-1-3]|uniref:MBL fold metallo-hydrolase n=1 Tax=Mesorhizobium sp. B4-1-3 TaxID=2589889 RepID=UPI00112DAFD8|nr:MBL fold metallo-hydrolase [Mesorhizobium sp. B4-1-3]TPI14756.1 MBL fold metallo-hydrolase [Mesorhizobium sp. B4-1-3]